MDDPCRPPVELRAAVKAISLKILEICKKDAKEIGWAVIGHGSMERDLDLLAIPWTQDAVHHKVFLDVLQKALSGFWEGPCYRSKTPESKPHGRYAWMLYGDSNKLIRSHAGVHPFIDLSIVDSRIEEERYRDPK